MLSLDFHAEELVSFFAGDEQQLLVRPAAALVEHRLHLGQPQRAGIFGMSIAVKLPLMN